jgi:dTDP-4-dehydrorhamnose reductase
MKDIIILGSNGMLGQMVNKYFISNQYNVINYNERFDELSAVEYVQKLNEYPNSIIINCIGRIWQKSDKSNDLLWSNSVLPLSLSRSLKKSHILIHPSTDCVFSGMKFAPYKVNEFHDALDLYGWSKSLGETALQKRENTLIVRVSIIGLDNNSNKGLLQWFLNNPQKASLNGYTNHFWNGITTLEWCKQLHIMMNASNFEYYLNEKKIIQLGTERQISKYNLLKLFQKCFNTDFIIDPISMPTEINKCLVSEMEVPELQFQINEMINFWNYKVL